MLAPMLQRLARARAASPALGTRAQLRPWCSATAGSQLTAPAYHRMADATLDAALEVYEDLSDARGDLHLDVEYADGVLNVSIGEHGTFVLNKQAPNLQLWLSSPISGPLRYDFCGDAATWLNTRDGHEMFSLLATDFEELTGEAAVDFSSTREGVADVWRSLR